MIVDGFGLSRSMPSIRRLRGIALQALWRLPSRRVAALKIRRFSLQPPQPYPSRGWALRRLCRPERKWRHSGGRGLEYSIRLYEAADLPRLLEITAETFGPVS